MIPSARTEFQQFWGLNWHKISCRPLYPNGNLGIVGIEKADELLIAMTLHISMSAALRYEHSA